MLFDFKKYAKRTACITEDNKTYTYDELEQLCREFAQNISERSLIFVVCSNTIGSLVGYVSAMKNGHVSLLLGKDVAREDVKRLCKKYLPSYLWMPEELADVWDMGVVVWRRWNYVLVSTQSPSPILYKDLALLLPTSGSTGNAKMVRLSYANLLANTESICQYLKITQEERAITALPMNYTYGLSVINTHLYKGATLLLTDRSVLDRKFWDYFQRYEATSFSGVPYTYEMLRVSGFASMQLPSLKTMTQAGGRLKEREQRYFSEYALQKGIDFYIMYGQTEATARISYLPTEYLEIHSGSVGKAIPGGKLSIQDEDGKELRPYENGELVYEGANVMLGYASGKEDLALGDVMSGVLRTGDLGYRDEEGLFYIVGRKKRFVKVCGKRMNLDDMESYLSQRLTREMCCVAIADKVGIVYVGENLDMVFESEVLNRINRKYGIPSREVVLRPISAMPHLTSGKVDYGELIETCMKDFYG